MAIATLSSKNQIVVPREAREALGVKAGDRLLVVVQGKSVTIMPEPASYAKALYGRSRGKYPANYLKNERDSWE